MQLPRARKIKFQSGFTPHPVKPRSSERGCRGALKVSSFIKKPRVSTRGAGFTLAELIISCSILVLASVNILIMFINSAFLFESSGNTVVALNDAQTVLEEIRRVSVSSLDSVDSTDWTTWADNHGLNTLKEESVQVSLADSSEDPLEVTVTVNWKDRARARALSLKQLVTQR